jgi:hypothetical protein
VQQGFPDSSGIFFAPDFVRHLEGLCQWCLTGSSLTRSRHAYPDMCAWFTVLLCQQEPYQPRVDLVGGSSSVEDAPLPDVSRGQVFASCVQARACHQRSSSRTMLFALMSSSLPAWEVDDFLYAVYDRADLAVILRHDLASTESSLWYRR